MKTKIPSIFALSAVILVQAFSAVAQTIHYPDYEKVRIVHPHIGRMTVTGNEEIKEALEISLGSTELADLVMNKSTEVAWPDLLNAEAKRQQYGDLISSLKCYMLAVSGDVCIIAVPAKQSGRLVKALQLREDFYIPIDCQSLALAEK